MTLNEEKATSFGSVAASYDRVRPAPPAAALDWLVPAGCAVAVDLAAGTGLFTRALLGRAARVVAVEPDDRMRDVLARRSPEVDVRKGWGESMPLQDASADAVFVSTAWHWLDLPRAVPEIARVLRPGGRLGVTWTSRDRDEDWVAELDLLRPNGVPAIDPPVPGSAEPTTAAEVRALLARQRAVLLPEGAPFGPGETASFGFSRTMSVDDMLEWLATRSSFLTASAADRESAFAMTKDALLNRAKAEPGGAGPVVQMPMRTWCWRADRG